MQNSNHAQQYVQTSAMDTVRQWYIQVNQQSYGPYDDDRLWGFVQEGRVNAQSLISLNPSGPYHSAIQNPILMHWISKALHNRQNGASQNIQTQPAQSQPVQSQLVQAQQVHAPTVRAQQIHAPQQQMQPNQSAQNIPQSQPMQTYNAHSQPHNPAHNNQAQNNQMQNNAASIQSTDIRNTVFLQSADINNMAQQADLQSPQINSVQNNSLKQSVFMVMAEIHSGNGMIFLQSLQNLGDVERIGGTVWILKSRANCEYIRDQLTNDLSGDDRLFVIDCYANQTAWYNLGLHVHERIAQLWTLET